MKKWKLKEAKARLSQLVNSPHRQHQKTIVNLTLF